MKLANKRNKKPLTKLSATNQDDEKKLLLPPASPASSSTRSSPDRSSGSASIDMNPKPTNPLIPQPGTRARKNVMPRYVPDDWDDTLPYGGKVYLARKKKPDSWPCIIIQVFLVAFAFGLIYYAWYHTDHMHFHAAKLYAHLGHVEAQAITAEKYLQGKGVDASHEEAFKWYKQAADQGHPHSSYNLAVGHMQGHSVGLEPGEARRLIKHAAENGVPEAMNAMKLCERTDQCDV